LTVYPSPGSVTYFSHSHPWGFAFPSPLLSFRSTPASRPSFSGMPPPVLRSEDRFPLGVGGGPLVAGSRPVPSISPLARLGFRFHRSGRRDDRSGFGFPPLSPSHAVHPVTEMTFRVVSSPFRLFRFRPIRSGVGFRSDPKIVPSTSRLVGFPFGFAPATRFDHPPSC
jgi:hypothetical protein